MISRRLLRSGAVLAVAIALLCSEKFARADLVITVQEDSGKTKTFTVTGSPTSDLATSLGVINTPDFKIVNLAGEANQTPGVASLNGSNTSITLTDKGSAGPHVLHITITGTGYTNPTAPVTVSSQIGGSVGLANTGDTLTFQSFVPSGNGLGAQNPTVTTAKSYQNTINPTLSTQPTGTYSIEQTIDIKLITTGDNLNFSSTTDLTAVAPAPAGIILALTGLPSLLFGAWVRRRKAKVAG